MIYTVVDLETNEAEVYQDATRAAEKIGITYRTVWYNSKKPCKKWGKYMLYYVKDGIIKSRRGKKR